jgi:hypothetical protein
MFKPDYAERFQQLPWNIDAGETPDSRRSKGTGLEWVSGFRCPASGRRNLTGHRVPDTGCREKRPAGS